MDGRMCKDFIIDEDMIMEYVGSGGEVVIPSGVTDIFFEAFYGAAIITSVKIPGTILDVSPFVFERSYALRSVILCEGVEVINACAFNDCEVLESIYLPRTIKEIKMNAFANCPRLKNVYYNGSKEEWGLIAKAEDWDENTNDYGIIFGYNANME